MCREPANEMSQAHAAALLKNLSSAPSLASGVAAALGMADPGAAGKGQVDAEVDHLLSVSAVAPPAAPISPKESGATSPSTFTKLMRHMSPKGSKGKMQFANTTAGNQYQV